MDSSTLRKLIAEAKIEKAVDELLAYSSNVGLTDLRDSVNLLSAKYKKGKKSSMMGIITNAEWMQIEAQVGYALLQLADELPSTSSNSVSTTATPNPNKKRVFISYNHADSVEAQKLKEALREAGLDVIIDEEAMAAGADIRSFIEESVQNSEITLSIVSEKSLLSGWVAMETINTFYLSKFDQNKKFIACYKDATFMDDHFVLTAGKKLNSDIKELDVLISEYTAEGLNFTNLVSKRTRLFDLKSNLATIVDKLNNSLTLDISEANWPRSIDKIIKGIVG